MRALSRRMQNQIGKHSAHVLREQHGIPFLGFPVLRFDWKPTCAWIIRSSCWHAVTHAFSARLFTLPKEAAHKRVRNLVSDNKVRS